MRKRQHFIGLWLDDKEHKQLTKLCEQSGLSASALMRKFIIDEEIKQRPPEEYAALLRELSAIGNNINQLAHWANARGSAREEEIQKAAELAREAWHKVKETL